jgi:hypothetical protein
MEALVALEQEALDGAQVELTEFGQTIRRKHFALSHTVYLNHGGLGLPPLALMHLRTALEHLAEEQPMRFHRDILPPSFARAKGMVAEYLGCTPTSLSFVQNASVGLFHVLKSVHLRPGDIVLVTNVFYHSVADTVRHLVAAAGASLVIVPLTLPIESKDAVVEAFTNTLNGLDADKVRLAVIDHISSKPSVVLPIHRLLKICRQKHILTLVDGAHAPGQVVFGPHAASVSTNGENTGGNISGASDDDLCVPSLEHLGCDFYVGNFHKWMLVPRGCAFLFVSPDALAVATTASTTSGTAASTAAGRKLSNVDLALLTPLMPPPPSHASFDGETGYYIDHGTVLMLLLASCCFLLLLAAALPAPPAFWQRFPSSNSSSSRSFLPPPPHMHNPISLPGHLRREYTRLHFLPLPARRAPARPTDRNATDL